MFKAGDFVRLPREIPSDATEWGGPGWSPFMDQFLGKVGEVEEVHKDNFPLIKVNGYWWKFKWVEKISAREAHSITEIDSWTRTEERIRERRDAHFRKIFGG
jgi:hypothetical protein